MKFLKSLHSRKFVSVEKQIKGYVAAGRLPFSPGYDLYRSSLIQKTLDDDMLMERFRRHESLPADFGQYIDERVVEYPWLLSRLEPATKTLLDAGSTLNNLTILDYGGLAAYKKYIVTLAPESVCYWERGISYVFSDLRNLLFKDNYFDVVACISTLEHVGMDNTALYTGDVSFQENIHDDYLKVVRELHRVLKPGGKCYITVPFGQYQYDVFQQQFNTGMVANVIESFKPTQFNEHYFKYRESGWNTAKQEECKDAQYFNVHKTKYFDVNSTQDFDADKAAAARAVAALELTK
jgi:SAM-dependent methyltransferase